MVPSLALRKSLESVLVVLIVTDGSSTQYPGDHERRAKKNKELIECCRILGVSEVEHGNLPDMQLDSVPHHEINNYLSKSFEKWKPQTVYTHFPDVNMDHQRIFQSTLVAARPRTGCSVRKLLLYPTPSATEWDVPVLKRPFEANEYVDISDFLETKLEGLAAYETEIRPYPHPRSAEAVSATSRACGQKVGMAHAEEFMMIRALR